MPTQEEVDPVGMESELSQSDSDVGQVCEGFVVEASSTESDIVSEQVRRSSQVSPAKIKGTFSLKDLIVNLQ